MYIGMLSIGEGRGGKGRGTFLIKEQWEKSLLSLGAKNSDEHLLHCCKLNALRKIHVHMSLVNKVTSKKCKRTGRLTSQG